MELTPKQLKFVEAYALEPNGEKAAIAAGYSKRTAASQASRLLKHVKVAAELERRRKILQMETGITPARVLEELARVGFADIRQLVKWRSNVLALEEDDATGDQATRAENEVILTDSDQIPDALAAAISEISQGKDGQLRVKMWPKLPALVKMGEHFGMFRAGAPVQPMGKKERANHDAQTAGLGTEWGDDLRADMPGSSATH